MRPITKKWAETLICPFMSKRRKPYGVNCRSDECMAWQYIGTSVRESLAAITPKPEDIQKIGVCLLVRDEEEI